MIRVTTHAGGARFAVKVVPGASRDRIAGALGDALKIAVAKRASGGQANDAVIKLLAEMLRVSPRHVQIIRGDAAARKEIFVEGIDVDALAAKLADLV
jgi:uncharacterized protein